MNEEENHQNEHISTDDSYSWKRSDEGFSLKEVNDEETAEEGNHYSWKRSDGTSHGDHSDVEDDEDMALEEPVMEGVDDLPLFADDTNKQLHAAIRAKEKRMEKIASEFKESTSRVEIMKEHLKNVKQELQHTQALHNSKLKEVSSEEHLKQISDREIGRIRQEISKIKAEENEITDKLNTVQNFIFKGNEDMDNFKMQMNWNQEELEQWALASRQKEEDNLALQKYTRADEGKIKELTLAIEKSTRILQEKKKILEDETTETQAKQIELDKAAEEFRTLHLDRQKLVKQWQDTIESMKRRDIDIATAAEEFSNIRQEMDKQIDSLNENKQRLKMQDQDNADLKTKISAKERQHASCRQELQKTSTKLQEFRDEVEVMKNELSSAAGDLLQKRTQNSNMLSQLDDLRIELEDATAKLKQSKKTHELYTNTTLDAESFAKKLEEEVSQNENQLKHTEKAIAQQKEEMFKRSQSLFNLRQEEATLIAEISGAQAAGKNLQTKIKQLDVSALRQQELVYNGEFQIQQMERKVVRASGVRSADETKVLKAEIDRLQEILNKEKSQLTMLSTQCKKLDEEKRGQDRVYSNYVKKSEEIKAKISHLDLENESAIICLKKFLKEKEESLVQHDVLKLEIKRLRDSLNSRADEVFTLENRKFQLEQSMEERKKEISMHREIQRAQLKATEEERHKISLEYTERQMRVTKLQAKFETLCKVSAYGNTNDDDCGGEEKSQAYYVIKAAQRREELQREGDELDDKIRVAEREVRALKKTLDHLEVRNTEYRKSFQRADMDSSDALKMTHLEEQIKTSKDALFKRKKELQRLQTDVEEDEQRLKQMKIQSEHLQEHNKNLTSALNQVNKEVANEKSKVDKFKAKMEKLIKRHRASRNSKSETLEEIVFGTHATKDIINNVLYTLNQLSNEYPEIRDSLMTSLNQKAMIIPTRPQSRLHTATKGMKATVRPLSARSDTSVSSAKSTSSSTKGNQSQTRVPVEVSRVQMSL